MFYFPFILQKMHHTINILLHFILEITPCQFIEVFFILFSPALLRCDWHMTLSVRCTMYWFHFLIVFLLLHRTPVCGCIIIYSATLKCFPYFAAMNSLVYVCFHIVGSVFSIAKSGTSGSMCSLLDLQNFSPRGLCHFAFPLICFESSCFPIVSPQNVGVIILFFVRWKMVLQGTLNLLSLIIREIKNLFIYRRAFLIIFLLWNAGSYLLPIFLLVFVLIFT